MTRDELVFDWSNTETRLVDKIVAIVLVLTFFTLFFGLIDIRVGSAFERSTETASIIRFESEELADKWLLIAEEGGPSPGRLEIVSSVPGADASLESMSGDPFADVGYEVSLRPLLANSGVSGIELATKGSRVFPETEIRGNDGAAPVDGSIAETGPMQPVITPYDNAALEWMPKSLPVFSLVEGTDTSGSPWRFAIGLRSDGTISDCIALGGGEAGLEEIRGWLRRVKFGDGEDERWLGLRVELINRRQDGSGTQ
ncbi:MAG: hypothetical protein ACSHX9_02270 [Luteolibacter sp.]